MDLIEIRTASGGVLVRLSPGLRELIPLSAHGRRAAGQEEEKEWKSPHPVSVIRLCRLIKGRLVSRRFC
jgi:hypothetical protein